MNYRSKLNRKLTDMELNLLGRASARVIVTSVGYSPECKTEYECCMMLAACGLMKQEWGMPSTAAFTTTDQGREAAIEGAA